MYFNNRIFIPCCEIKLWGRTVTKIFHCAVTMSKILGEQRAFINSEWFTWWRVYWGPFQPLSISGFLSIVAWPSGLTLKVSEGYDFGICSFKNLCWVDIRSGALSGLVTCAEKRHVTWNTKFWGARLYPPFPVRHHVAIRKDQSIVLLKNRYNVKQLKNREKEINSDFD